MPDNRGRKVVKAAERSKEIFAEALALMVPAERCSFLDNAHVGNTALREEVESLLSAPGAWQVFTANQLKLENYEKKHNHPVAARRWAEPLSFRFGPATHLDQSHTWPYQPGQCGRL
jgi:hypothetical protein